MEENGRIEVDPKSTDVVLYKTRLHEKSVLI